MIHLLAYMLGPSWFTVYAAQKFAESSTVNKMEDHHVHQYLQLFTTSDKFYLKPSQLCCDSKHVLIIDRQSGEAVVKNINLASILGAEEDFKLIFGFLGSIKLISGLYLVIVTDRMLLGKLHGQPVFQVVSTDIIPYARSTSHLTQRQVEDNERYESMVRSMLELPGAYFCCSHDLTHSLQETHDLAPQHFTKSLLARADKRFVWNRHLLKDFTNSQFGQFTLPLIQGFVSINHTQVRGSKLTWSLVSRRSVDRIGTRLFVRGIDVQGNAANHVLTEQVIDCEYIMTVSSFVLTRGSVPLSWTQYPDLSLKPTAQVAKKNHLGPFMQHFRDQQRRYGDIVCVNLINQTGKEGVLEESYRGTVDFAMRDAHPKLAGLKYRPFDFHAECGSMNYRKLDILINSVSKELEDFGYFYLEGPKVVKRQSGTFRVNCLDCLDRTNVVQSLLAKLQLRAALKKMGIIRGDEELADLDHMVNNVWADHADVLSIQYSGTKALKTDFTRTGHRTCNGLIQDARSAITRYYLNNFTDGFKQDAFDVFLGNYTVPDGKYNRLPSPLTARRSWQYYTFPSVFLTAMSMFCASLIFPTYYNIEALLCLTFSASIAMVTLAYIFRNGKEFVDRPKLYIRGHRLH